MKKEINSAKKMMLALLLTCVCFSSYGLSVQVPMHIIKTGSASDGSTLAPPRPWYIWLKNTFKCSEQPYNFDR